jgi:hypothetical protein
MTANPPHTCPAKDCTVKVPFEQLACEDHWVKLPWRLRTNLSQAYRHRDYGAHGVALDAALGWYASHDADGAPEARGGHTTTTVQAQ